MLLHNSDINMGIANILHHPTGLYDHLEPRNTKWLDENPWKVQSISAKIPTLNLVSYFSWL